MSVNEESTTSGMLAGRYRMGELIGRGGMGAVWLAEDTVIGRRVAIKEVRLPEGLPDAERAVISERVLREARTAGRLSDPCIVTVYDVVFSGGRNYIVMEYVPSRTLADIVRAEGSLAPERVAEIAEQVLAGLDSAHAAGVVHRDVKPGNILVTAEGRVKLTDFGIAQAVDDPRLTSSDALIGSPAFMAPERISEGSKGGVTPASDLWSLGATLFQAVEGYPPFERGNTAATLHAIMTEVPYLSRCAGPLASVIMGLLVVNPAGRLTSAQAHGLLARTAEHPAPPSGAPPSGAAPSGAGAQRGPAVPGRPTAQDGGVAPGGTRFAPGGPGAAVGLAAQRDPGIPAGRAAQGGTVTPGGTRVAGPPPNSGYDGPPGTPHAGAREAPGGGVPGRPRRGRAGLVAAVAVVVLAAVFAGGVLADRMLATPGAPRNWVTPLTYGDGGQIPEFGLDVGNCASGQIRAGRRFPSGTSVDCGQPHDFEVFGQTGYDSDQVIGYPGYNELAAIAQSWCTSDFDNGPINVPNRASALKYTAVVPSTKSWGNGKPPLNPYTDKTDRTIYCILYRADNTQLSTPVATPTSS